MRKIQVLVLCILLLNDVNIYPDVSFLKTFNPYKNMAVGQNPANLRTYDTVNSKMKENSLFKKQPVAATDSSGTRTYFCGRLRTTISKDGQVSISLGNVTKTMDKEGNLLSVSKRIKGTNMVEISDSDGNITGYRAVGANGLAYQEFDDQYNLLKTYKYNKFNNKLVYTLDELNKNMTVYDKFGREKGVFGYDGYVISTSQYDDISYESSEDGKSIIEVINTDKNADAKLLVTKKTYTVVGNTSNGDGTINVSFRCNTSYYDREGLISKVVDDDGITVSEYFYKRDNYGNKVLTHVLNPKDKSITYYEKGRPIEERNDMGGLTKKYYYNKSKLLYTISMGANETFNSVTYYNKAGKAILTTHKFIQYDPSSPDKIDFVCGEEYSVILNEDEIKKIEDGISSLKEGKDYIIRKEKNLQTGDYEDVYYWVPDGIEGVNYVKKEIKNDEGEIEIRFYMINEKYIYDEKGNIDYVIDLRYNTRTYYKNNKMYYTAANDDSTRGINVIETPNDPRLLKIFAWDKPLEYESEEDPATSLVYVFDIKTQTTQWFDIDSKFMYLTYNDRLISSNIYDGAQLAGTWDNQKKQLTILRNERQWLTLELPFQPDIFFIRKILSFTNGDSVDTDSINNYVEYCVFKEKLLEDEFELVKNHISSFESYNELKHIFIVKNSEYDEVGFIEYLKSL